MIIKRYRWLTLLIVSLLWNAIFVQPAFASDKSKVRFETNVCIQAARYWDLVEKTRLIILNSAEEPNAEQQSVQLDELSQQWRELSSVCTESGLPLAIEGSFVAQSLEDIKNNDFSPADLLEFSSWLEKLIETRQIQLAQENPQAVAKLDKILAAPEFSWPTETKNPLIEWVNSLILKFLNWLDSLNSGNPFQLSGPLELLARIGLPFLAILFLGMLAVYISLNLRRSFASSAALNSLTQSGDGLLNAEEAFALANSMANQGDMRNAVRYLYLSSLFALDERGLLRFDKARTNREYLNSLLANKGLLASDHASRLVISTFINLVDGFDQIWYGYHPIDRQGYQAYALQVSEIKRAVGYNISKNTPGTYITPSTKDGI